MDKASEFDHLIKIVFVGDSAVGKSSILLRFTEGHFDQNVAATIGVDFKVHMLDFKNEVKVNLTIWDTAGQEKFSSMTSSYYRGAHGIFLVYDVTNKETFDHIKKWLNEIDMYATSSNIIKMLIGNKIDLGDSMRRVSTEEGATFAKQNGLLFQECSPKEDVGINSAFESLINAVLDSPVLHEETATKKKGQEGSGGSTVRVGGERTDSAGAGANYCC